MNKKADTVGAEEKSTVEITLLDPLGKSIEGLRYQIRDGAKIVRKGITDSQGKIEAFVSDIGRELTVHVERFASEEMKQIKTLFPWAEDFRIKLVSGKVKESVPLKPAQGDPGAYKRKTYIVKPRDTLGGIAQEHQTTAAALAKLNGIRVTDIIREGQVLKVPPNPAHEKSKAPAPDTGSAKSRSDNRPTTPVTPAKPASPQKADDRGANGTPKTAVDFKCSQTSCIRLGMKGPLIEEINIRLIGFGGSVTSNALLSDFTAETEGAVKQFQRDYMGAPETGKVCGGVLSAIDDFGRKYVVPISAMKCPCNSCQGFGKGRKDGKSVGFDKAGIEYPGDASGTDMVDSGLIILYG